MDVSGMDVMAIAHPAAVGNGDDEGPGNARGLETMATPMWQQQPKIAPTADVAANV